MDLSPLDLSTQRTAGGSLLTSFLGALQASIAVLLTISYGVIATQLQILKESSSKDVSQLCVRFFLPALLITNVGSELHLDTISRYVPILVWSVFYTFLSMGLGIAATRAFNLPSWTSPAVAFNNTTSLPLLLIQSLDAAGILSSLLMSDEDSTTEAVKRAKSYHLVCAMVGNSLTFALGPKLLDGEESPDVKEEDEEEADKSVDGDSDLTTVEGTEDVEAGRIGQNGHGNTITNGGAQGNGEEYVDEETSLLPDPIVRLGGQAGREVSGRSKRFWDKLPVWLHTTLNFSYAFLNAPLIGAVIGATIGLVPTLHRAFFNTMDQGGFFKAWLTSSIRNVGELFAPLQLVVVGSKLSGGLRKWKNGEESGEVPWSAMSFVFIVRFLIWPLISIPLIWALAAKTNLLGQDPMLWFTMMMMPTGPPAILLTALADVKGCDEREKMAIAKFLTIAYVISPLICFSVVGSLKASEAVRNPT
ncbi:MAG: hypothetical protein M1837_005591 [Sclerophora amabilis]|nr:MAG: hypothetical protein M1837_005591 [Sclerophora amabilis]